MPKSPAAYSTIPPQARRALEKLGDDLALARVRRREPQRVWAKRLGISVPTLARLEKGDPGVGIGIVATALWMMGRSPALAALADPASDLGALESDVRSAMERRAVRRGASIEARLGRKKTPRE